MSGLTPQRHLLLLMIKGAPGGDEQSTVTQLSERLQLAQSTVTELVRRAEEAGLIERTQSQRDARVAHLRLTPEGERRLMLSFTELETEMAELLHRLEQVVEVQHERGHRADGDDALVGEPPTDTHDRRDADDPEVLDEREVAHRDPGRLHVRVVLGLVGLLEP